ncbi:MAG: molecular chaperone DnaJ, partial [Clostridia bacterium]|nr:molecular chaperone DnaJ [Clostridia bacterium]
YGGGQSYSGQASFAAVRNLISQSRITEAMSMLSSLPRTAEWYYLSGVIRIQSGWYDQGISFLRTAVQMEPGNQEYRDALNNVESRTNTYNTSTSGNSNSGCCGCDTCTLCTSMSCCYCCC